jgi:uncharacterized protein with HEPN domain
VSSEGGGRGGRARDAKGALESALRVGRRALDLVAKDDEASYLANEERQYAIERLLIRFGEALKDVPDDVLSSVAADIDWRGPKSFRDLASHWYEDGLDHALIWRALRNDLPAMVEAIERWGKRGA